MKILTRIVPSTSSSRVNLSHLDVIVKRCFLKQTLKLEQTSFSLQKSSFSSGFYNFPSFRHDQLQVIKCKEPSPRPDPHTLKFGHHFTDHMLEIRWKEDTGWAAPVISPLHNFSMHPASKCIHYACQLFEGLKAYRGVDGKIRMFRPDMNMKRMLNSAERSYFPGFDAEELMKCMSQLIRLDEGFVFPAETNTALYIRPAMIGSEGTLGVHASTEGILFVLLSPVGSYFAAGQTSAVSLLANPSYVRAWPGGTGDKKLGSNYGPTIYVQKKAASEGCQQVLWLFGDENLLTEAGTMNIFIVLKGNDGKKQLITPPLGDGLILPGVTRDSILQLASNWDDVQVIERRILMKEVQELVKDGRLLELFGAGTACVVSPVNRISFKGEDINIPCEGEISSRILKTLTDIQYARINMHPEWMREV